MDRPCVSVIVCTYEPVAEKLERTLLSVKRQRGIEYELIITDDGSIAFDMAFVKNLLIDVKNSRIFLHEKNVGTVNNIYSALKLCSGEYVYCISPGDMLYGEDTLRRLYKTAKKSDKGIVFGNALNYNFRDKNIKFYPVNEPRMPELYNALGSSFLCQLSFYYANRPVGVTYLRKRDIFLMYMDMIKDQVRFVEDSTTSLLYLADGGKIGYTNMPVVWYEYGSGVSTSKSEKWEKKLKKDFDMLDNILVKKHSRSKLVRYHYLHNGGSLMGRADYAAAKAILYLLKKIGKLRNLFRLCHDSKELSDRFPL